MAGNGILGAALMFGIIMSGMMGWYTIMAFPPLLLLVLDYLSLKYLGKYHGLYRLYGDIAGGTWFVFICFLNEKLCGIKMVFYGDVPANRSESFVMISNHRTRLDWFYLWSFILRKGNLLHEKIVLKDGLKKVPFFGWSMQIFLFMFLKRKWDEDQKNIFDVLNSFVRSRYPIQLLIFPEGTDLSEHNRKLNAAYAQKNNLEMYNYLLHPRLKGFTSLVEILRPNLKAIYDVTIGYPDYIPQSEEGLYKGIYSKEIHFHLKRHSIESVPIEETELGKWCSQKWKEKEQLLDQFYKTKSFPQKHETKNADLLLYSSAVFWMIVISTGIYSLVSSSTGRWLFLIGAIINATLTYLGGLDLIEVKLFNVKPQKSN